ncbi:hypothetical protein BYT27DRAFT_7202510 [Phlegmacium glaucopus]|nr:hypothetical protein BYT27DRAFT_7202510 [Phlegmacium glaucopus]
MILQLRNLASRVWSAIPSLSRSINSRAASTPVPPIRDPAVFPQVLSPNYNLESIKSPTDFLKAIGRSCETKISVESWEDFWRKDGLLLKKDGVSIRDRRYILWCMEKYRLGYLIREFAHELPPKKTIRGWGPKVQNGKRIRSRRIKSKK